MASQGEDLIDAWAAHELVGGVFFFGVLGIIVGVAYDRWTKKPI